MSKTIRILATGLALIATGATFATAPALAQPPAASASASAPKLIVAISVDQFSADLFAEYRPLYTAGLKRLEQGGVYPSGYQSHAATETCPGHSTILTGSHPARTGIVANNWYDLSLARADKKVYCTEDPTVAGSTSDNYTVSPQYLKVPTLGDRMKAAHPGSRVVSIAGKDRAAVMMGGHAIDQVWYWAGKQFVTLPGRTGAVPPAVARANAQATALLARDVTDPLPAACRSHAQAVAVGGRMVGALGVRRAGDAGRFRATAAFDRLVTDIAVDLIGTLRLGKGDTPDVLSIGLSATDYVGHTFGTEGAEMCAQVLGVDANVGRILAALDAAHTPYVVVLTADHGGHDVPERNDRRGMADAVRVDPALSPNAVGDAVARELGLTGLPGPLLYGDAPFGDMYLSRAIPADRRRRVLEVIRARYLAHPQVAAVFTADDLRRMPAPTGPVDEWSVAERFRASFDPERSGDLLVALKPRVTPISDPTKSYIATHGSVWNYDRRVPILFYRPGMTGYEQPLPVETVDILPTLAALVALPVPPAEIDGRCLDLDPGAGDSCAGGAAIP